MQNQYKKDSDELPNTKMSLAKLSNFYEVFNPQLEMAIAEEREYQKHKPLDDPERDFFDMAKCFAKSIDESKFIAYLEDHQEPIIDGCSSEEIYDLNGAKAGSSHEETNLQYSGQSQTRP